MSAKEDVCPADGDSQEPVLYMGDEVEIYHNVNIISRNDAELCLQEYSPSFNWPKNKARVLDIGSADGRVTATILSKFLPSDYEVLIGVDVNPKSVKFANDKYENKRVKFLHLNIEGELPDDMKEGFDHIFSFYTFNWFHNHQKAFTNVYNILQKNGEFFAIFMLFSDIYLIFEILAKSTKWAPWMPNYNNFASPYYDFQDPDVYVRRMLQNIGFNVLDVRCKQRLFYFDSIDTMKDMLTAINPYNVPKEMWPQFLHEYIEIQRNMLLIDEAKRVKTRYNLMIIHCSK